MKKKIVCICVCILLLPSALSSVSTAEEDYSDLENMTIKEMITRYDPKCKDMTAEEISMYIENVRIKSPPEVIFGDSDGSSLQAPKNLVNNPIIYEPPWDYYYLKDLTEQWGIASGGWEGDIDGYQAWEKIVTIAGPGLGEVSVTVWTIHGFNFLAPVTGIYTFTFDYHVQGYLYGLISGVPIASACASSEVALFFRVGSTEVREDIIYDQTIPIVHESYTRYFDKTRTVNMVVQLYEGNYYQIAGIAGIKGRSVGALIAFAETVNYLDDTSEPGWADGAILERVTIDGPCDFVAQDIWVSSQPDDFNKEHVITSAPENEDVYIHFAYKWKALYTSPYQTVALAICDPIYIQDFSDPPESTRIICHKYFFDIVDHPIEYGIRGLVDVSDVVHEIEEDNNIIECKFLVIGRIELSPSSYNFGTVKVGEKCKTMFTLKTHSKFEVNGNIYLEGDSDFTILYGGGEFSLPPQQYELYIYVEFCPSSEGSKSATLIVDGWNCNDNVSSLDGRGRKKFSYERHMAESFPYVL